MSTLDRLPPTAAGGIWRRLRASVRRFRWLAPGLVAGLAVSAAYLRGHEYPAFGAGLYLAMAERIVGTLPLLPDVVPHYTAEGVPFAYPPLQFVVTGLLVEVAGLDPFAVATVVPLAVSLLALVPLYCFAESLLGSRRAAGLAALLAATAPPLLQWQISAGGIVRAPAYLFTVVGLYTGLRLFRDGGRRWLWASLGAFTLTVLSHPVYTVFFVLSYLTLYGAFDATPRGLRLGAVVGVGGAVLASPWWAQVVATHGVQTLTGAAGTHGGIGQQLPDLLLLVTAPDAGRSRAVLFAVRPDLFDFSTPGMAVITLWSLVVVAAWTTLLWARRRLTFLTAWAPLSVVFVSKPRFSFLIGAVMVGAVVDRHVLPALPRRPDRGPGIAQVTVGALLFTATAGTGVLYAGGHLDSHAGSPAQPAFVDDSDVAAMQWVAASTDPGAEFVVLGDAAEWFPYRTDRTMLVSPWGTEWRGHARYQQQLQAFNRLSTCRTAGCLTRQLHYRGVTPDYVYVPRGRYTVRGMAVTKTGELEAGLTASPRYELVHENAGVAVYEVLGLPAGSPPTGDQTAVEPPMPLLGDRGAPP